MTDAKSIFSTAMRWLGLLLLLASLALTVWLYQPLPANPHSLELASRATEFRAEVIRDSWGVPHILGKRDADVSFGLAYAHAEDDFETIQETVAATRGVLASYQGAQAAPTDYLVSLLDVWGTIERDYADKVPEDVKLIADSYAQGLNLYAAHHPQETWRGLAPFHAEDVIAGFIFKTPFFYGLDKVLLDLFDDQRQAELALTPDGEKSAWRQRPRTSAELGSNALAVNAARSGESTTHLLINSHQPMTGPVAWYEAHLMSEQGINIMGGLFPGTPLILHGFNANLGWANTVNHIDLSDTYVLERNPENQQQYRLDGQWLDFDVEEVNIDVKLLGPFRYPAKRRLLRSRHGPVIEGKHQTFALRYAGMGEIRQLEQYYRFNQADDLQSFMKAMALNALPSINYIYADREDNIAFIHNAQYPARNDGPDWSKDLPGDRAELIWDGYRPFADIPKLVNPQSGLVFNANNTPFSATDGPDNLQPEQFPRSMGLAEDQTNRSRRLMELTDGHSLLGKQAILEIKFDNRYSTESEKYATIKKVLALDVSDEPQLTEAIAVLQDWDRHTNQQNRQAALAITVLRKLHRSGEQDELSPEAMKAALRWSVEHLRGRHGAIDPPWGEVNRLIRGDLNLPLDGGPDVLRAIYSVGLDESEPAYATHGDTWMALVSWDADGRQSADTLNQFGSASRRPESKHYADQAPLFAAKQWRKALINLDEIRANAERSYFPNQLGKQE